ncbi:hypothetical protein Tco_0163776 [Tanacetum coccineum]
MITINAPRTFWNLVQQSSAATCHHSIGQPPPARYLVHLPQSIIKGDAAATWRAVIGQPPVTCQSTWTVNGRSTVVNGKSTIVQRWSTAGQPPPDHRSTTTGPPVNGGRPPINSGRKPVGLGQRSGRVATWTTQRVPRGNWYIILTRGKPGVRTCDLKERNLSQLSVPTDLGIVSLILCAIIYLMAYWTGSDSY